MKNIIWFAIAFLLFSCDKDEPTVCLIEPEPEQWEKFIGDYLVYDTLGNYSHDMRIEHYFSGPNEYGNEKDSLKIYNFNNQFEFEFEFDTSIDPNFIDIENVNLLINDAGNQFYFWHYSDDLDTPQIENYYTNDTIYLSFLLDNTPYWVEDGVPYFRCECREVAVKQN